MRKYIPFLGLMLIGLVVTIFLVQKQTQTKSRAAGEAVLEAEGGVPNSPATVKCDDTNASGGCYVQFIGTTTIPLSLGNKYGIGLLSFEPAAMNQFQWSKQLVGPKGFIKFYWPDIRLATTTPPADLVNAVNWAYDNNLIPVVRIDGSTANQNRCGTDAAFTCEQLAQTIKLVVNGLPRRNGIPLWIEIMNENNYDNNWGGASGYKASGNEYGRALLLIAQAIRTIGDPRIKIMNGGLAPDWGLQFGSGVTTAQFIRDMFMNNPLLLTGNNGAPVIDAWGSHPYPGSTSATTTYHTNYPTKTTTDIPAIDSYFAEQKVLASVGMPANFPVILSETGYESNPANNLPFDQTTRANYMLEAIKRYNSWSEVVTFVPFIISDFPGGSTFFSSYLWVPITSGTNPDGTPTTPYPIYTQVRNAKLNGTDH